MFAQSGLDSQSENIGIYLPTIDVAVTYRRRELEELNGPEFTESLAIHEATHGSSRHNTTRVLMVDDASGKTQLAMKDARIGQAIRSHPTRVIAEEETETGENFVGLFWEEAVAEYVRGVYVKEVLGKPGGFTDFTEEVTKPIGHNGLTPVPLSSRYAYTVENGRKTFVDAAFAASGLELLVQRDPELLPAFLQARNETAGLQDVARRINAIAPGLYEAIRDGYNTESEFNAGASRIVEALAEMDNAKASDQSTYA
jgi:hypothetical protein